MSDGSGAAPGGAADGPPVGYEVSHGEGLVVRGVLGPDLLRVPEVAELLGQTVEVRVTVGDRPPQPTRPKASQEDWERFFAENGRDFLDYDHFDRQRAVEQEVYERHNNRGGRRTMPEHDVAASGPATAGQPTAAAPSREEVEAALAALRGGGFDFDWWDAKQAEEQAAIKAHLERQGIAYDPS